ncbi:leucine-rich repeat-containing protein 40-like [Schistocerca serialis cubense]|uniref:leucine-rich repeat-containing protein 40-like n=1 Tax=Schistocerca serialis cubense TaxID=2023355 RepID=UPI00214E5DD9|nr:leucine-rich repeat-containing protein 40-like [Schistocerca serialis cubense]
MDCLPQALAGLLNVVHLEIINCNLITIPVFIGDLPKLSVLVLAHNKLGLQENWDFLSRPHIRQNLAILDLQDNELHNLPKEVVELDELAICLLDDNFLETLPTSLKEMHGLSVLAACNNMMRIFPYNLFPLDEFALDLANNPFTSRYFVIPNRSQKYKVPSLKELAARTVVDYRLPVATRILPRCVMEYLQSVQFCAICSGGYFDSFVACRYVPRFRVYIEVLPGDGYLHGPGFILNLCSRRCMQPELKFCELLNHLTPEQYDDWIKDMF